MAHSILRYAITEHRRVVLSTKDTRDDKPYTVVEYADGKETARTEFEDYPDAYGAYLDAGCDMFQRERDLHRGGPSANATIRRRPTTRNPRQKPIRSPDDTLV